MKYWKQNLAVLVFIFGLPLAVFTADVNSEPLVGGLEPVEFCKLVGSGGLGEVLCFIMYFPGIVVIPLSIPDRPEPEPDPLTSVELEIDEIRIVEGCLVPITCNFEIVYTKPEACGIDGLAVNFDNGNRKTWLKQDLDKWRIEQEKLIVTVNRAFKFDYSDWNNPDNYTSWVRCQ